MFTLQQIKAAHAKVKTGADFPAYVKEIKDLGLQYYEFFVSDGRAVYHGDDDFTITGPSIYQEKKIAADASPESVRQIISEHQQGKSGFLTFCELVARAGVEKWVVDGQTMLCSYYNLQGNTMVAEPIPDRGY